MPARPPRRAVWPWLVLLLTALLVSAGISWDLWPLLVTASRLRPPSTIARPAPAAPSGERQARLFVPDAEGRLAERAVRIPQRPLLGDEARAVLAALRRDAQVPPPGAEVRRVFMDAFGILYLDLDRGFQQWVAASPAAAEPGVRALVATLVASFDAAKRVQLLVEGQELTATVGGLDLRRPLLSSLEAGEPAEGAARSAAPETERPR